jgi:hypothetical protein
MNIKKTVIVLTSTLGMLATSTWAQDENNWDWKIVPYLWAVGIEGTVSIGPVDQEVDVSFKDFLDDLDFGGAVYAELGKGRHAVHLDYTYIRLIPDPADLPSPPSPSGSTISSKMTINIFESAYNYRFEGHDGLALVIGARYIDLAMKMTPDIALSEPLPPELPVSNETLTAGPSWWDYFVGIKTHNEISTNWDFEFYGTIGGGDSDTPWSVQAMFGRRYSNENRLAWAFVYGISITRKTKAQRASLPDLMPLFTAS